MQDTLDVLIVFVYAQPKNPLGLKEAPLVKKSNTKCTSISTNGNSKWVAVFHSKKRKRIIFDIVDFPLWGIVDNQPTPLIWTSNNMFEPAIHIEGYIRAFEDPETKEEERSIIRECKNIIAEAEDEEDDEDQDEEDDEDQDEEDDEDQDQDEEDQDQDEEDQDQDEEAEEPILVRNR